MDKQQFILSTVGPMAEYTFPYLTSIIGIHDAQVGEHIGSGLRCVWQGKRAIATALHVADAAMQYPGRFAISAGYGMPPYLVHGPAHFDRGGDLALYYLSDDYALGRQDVAFWPEVRIEPSSDRLSTDYLFVHGFPDARSRLRILVASAASRLSPP